MKDSALGAATAPRVKSLGRMDYLVAWAAMQHFTDQRGPETADEIWLVEHAPVYTLGLNGKPEHLLRPGDIPLVKTDRGGQITYHGPGQVIAYLLIDLKRRGMGVRQLVGLMEQSVIDLLDEYGIHAARRAQAPGVYVAHAKIAAVGLRIKRGCSYHGVSLNADMDLRPFRAINPCGYPGLPVTQTRQLGITDSPPTLGGKLAQRLRETLTKDFTYHR